MSIREFLALVVGALDATGVPYMLTGSLAASYHGAPRATQDVDFVVDASLDALVALANSLESAGLYVSKDAVVEAARIRGQFNAVDPASGWKADFIVRKDRGFSRTEFDSRQVIEFSGLQLSIARPEDLIVAKLEWSKMGDSERQLLDAAEVLNVQGSGDLDVDRIQHWVDQLALESEWTRLKALARDRREPA